MKTVGSLFSGVGGIDLGLERAGFHTAWFCEANPYCRAVLARHWPGVPCYPDVRTLGCDVPRVDLLCGGFPCQPVSVAGKRLGSRDPRWLWPAFARVISQLRPAVVLLENVPGLRTAGLRDVLADLAELGFDAEWTIIRASDFGAPHIRARIFLVATDANRRELRLESGWLSRAYRACTHELGREGAGWAVADALGDAGHPRGTGDARDGPRRRDAGGSGQCSHVADAQCDGRHEAEYAINREGATAQPRGWAVEPDVGRVAHGIPHRVAQLRALGNAVVPQCAQWIGEQIMRRL